MNIMIRNRHNSFSWSQGNWFKKHSVAPLNIQEKQEPVRENKMFYKEDIRREGSQDGGGIEPGDHFLPHKFIVWMLSKYHKTTSESWWRTLGTIKAANCLQKEVGQNIKDKKRDKRVRDRGPFWGRSHKRGEVSKHQETLSLVGLYFGISKGNITGRKR